MQLRIEVAAPAPSRNAHGLFVRIASRLVGIARVDVRVQRRLEIAEDGVVDPQRPGRREHGIAEPAEVRQEPVALGRAQRVQMRHDRIRQQQASSPPAPGAGP